MGHLVLNTIESIRLCIRFHNFKNSRDFIFNHMAWKELIKARNSSIKAYHLRTSQEKKLYESIYFNYLTRSPFLKVVCHTFHYVKRKSGIPWMRTLETDCLRLIPWHLCIISGLLCSCVNDCVFQAHDSKYSFYIFLAIKVSW